MGPRVGVADELIDIVPEALTENVLVAVMERDGDVETDAVLDILGEPDDTALELSAAEAVKIEVADLVVVIERVRLGLGVPVILGNTDRVIRVVGVTVVLRTFEKDVVIEDVSVEEARAERLRLGLSVDLTDSELVRLRVARPEGAAERVAAAVAETDQRLVRDDVPLTDMVLVCAFEEDDVGVNVAEEDTVATDVERADPVGTTVATSDLDARDVPDGETDDGADRDAVFVEICE